MREHKLLLIIAALCAVVLAVMPPIAQPLAYHNFSDPRGWLGIPNFGDVVSNVPFAFVGLYGTWALARLKAPCPQFLSHEEWRAGMIACVGFFLVAFGSGYYHWNPSNTTLVWDRLPMTIGFMAIFAMMLMERASLAFGARMLMAMLAFGVASVAYWAWVDDLRPYVFVQFFPMLAIPLMLWRYPPRYDGVKYIGWVFFWYVAAKLLEHFDGEVLAMLNGWVSGHSLKHVAAAGATLAFVFYLVRRKPVDNPQSI